ncbi:MAG: ABC transporter permease [Rhodocyclaceae bacterium]|nr:ABC transporter permease [Rhodocyclaceae bacterium]
MSAATMTAPQYQASPGLWTLAWRRLIADRLAMISLLVVMAFFALMVASGTGLIAAKWADEVAVGYAPPSLFGTPATAVKNATSVSTAEPTENLYPGTVKDPLADEIAELKVQLGAQPGGGAKSSVGAGSTPLNDEIDYKDLDLGDLKVVDPIGPELAEILATTTAAVEKPRVDSLPFGADKWGHDVILKVIKGAETSIFVGLAAALVATIIGTILGAVSGYYGGWIDDFLNWFYSIFTAIPYLLLILAIAAVLNQKGVTTIVMILGLTGWTGVYRLVRAEYIKHSTREYVQAADAIGASNMRRMFIHIFPNVSHISLVQLSVHTVGFIKSEVILSFLGFGVPVDKVSWGSMLGEAQNELILGYWWQLAAATIAMAILVTAFSMFTDALRDALDPKIK